MESPELTKAIELAQAQLTQIQQARVNTYADLQVLTARARDIDHEYSATQSLLSQLQSLQASSADGPADTSANGPAEIETAKP